MSKDQPAPTFSFVRVARKYFVSAFVVFTFVTYAVHERVVSRGGGLDAGAAGAAQLAQTATSMVPTATPLILPSPSLPVPTATDGVTASVPTPTLAELPTTSQPLPTETLPLPTDTLPPATATLLPSTGVTTVRYKDGRYTGDVADAYWGTVQVEATIVQGQIQDVQFVDYPHDRRTSARINSIAMPYLTTEAVQAQSAEVDLISGATLTSRAFVESLSVALQSAAVHS